MRRLALGRSYIFTSRATSSGRVIARGGGIAEGPHRLILQERMYGEVGAAGTTNRQEVGCLTS